MKIKIRPADRLFSLHIRQLYDWTCQRCGRQHLPGNAALHNSHYWGRGNEGTRFEPDNCIPLCYGCHRLWGHGDQRDQYKAYMLKKLGTKRFKSLDVQAHTYYKKDDTKVILWLKTL